jgi:DNA-binding MarR family transcriptional regulator
MNSLCNCFSLRQATRRVTQLYDQAFASVGLKATQYSLLNQVGTLGPIALNPLAETMVMDRATLGHNVRPLAARGLVRLAVGKDRRSREVSITAAGRDLLVSARALWHQAQRSFESEMGKDTSAALRGLLHRVAATEFIRRAGDARPARGRTVS